MFKALRYFYNHHKWALLGFVSALAFVLYFGIHMAMDFLYFNDPRHQNEALKTWMTPKYVSMSYDVPPRKFKKILGIESMEGRKNSMQAIAARKGMTLAELEVIVREGAAAYHEEERREEEGDDDDDDDRSKPRRDDNQ